MKATHQRFMQISVFWSSQVKLCSNGRMSRPCIDCVTRLVVFLLVDMVYSWPFIPSWNTMCIVFFLSDAWFCLDLESAFDGLELIIWLRLWLLDFKRINLILFSRVHRNGYQKYEEHPSRWGEFVFPILVYSSILWFNDVNTTQFKFVESKPSFFNVA